MKKCTIQVTDAHGYPIGTEEYASAKLNCSIDNGTLFVNDEHGLPLGVHLAGRWSHIISDNAVKTDDEGEGEGPEHVDDETGEDVEPAAGAIYIDVEPRLRITDDTRYSLTEVVELLNALGFRVVQ